MRPVFIGGCDRSGTTLLAAQLARYRGVLALPESFFVAESARHALQAGEDVARTAERIGREYRFKAWRAAGCPEPDTFVADSPDARTLIERLVGAYAEAVGAGPVDIFVEHAPQNIRRAEEIARYYEDARFLHIVRDGRAVAASLLPLDWGPTNVVDMAQFWTDAVAAGFAAVERLGPERAMTVRYERLVAEPEESLAAIGAFLGVEGRPLRENGAGYAPPGYSAQTHQLVLAKPEKARIDRWREALTDRQIALFELEAGDRLETLGYRCISDRRRTPPPGPVERGVMRLQDAWLGRVQKARYRRRHGM